MEKLNTARIRLRSRIETKTASGREHSVIFHPNTVCRWFIKKITMEVFSDESVAEGRNCDGNGSWEYDGKCR
jgi:hypothetical protein